jgi:hypothetical protein
MSEIRANTISDAAGTGPVTLTGQYAAKAWVNFNGTGTVAIRESGNVASITDNDTGDYTVNFTTAMPDANYSVGGTASRLNTGDHGYMSTISLTTSAVQIGTSLRTVGSNDRDFVFAQITR